jgi:hypothetical protein
MKLKHFLLLYLIFFNSYNLVSQDQTVQKSFDKPVLMHYMPWFETPIFNGYWGWHWTMNNQNPDIVENDGNRQIASHYHPLIGPYSSIDPDVIEYHLLLMKYSGVDVLAVNWYGTHGTNGDIYSLLNNSNAIIDKTQELGMSFAIILEDRFSSSISDVQNNLSYANTNYFSRENYFRYGNENNPFLGIFGPITYQTESDWDLIMSSINTSLSFLTLWNQSDEVGANGSGEYAWIYQDETTNHSEFLNNFYLNNATSLDIVMGISYPGFHDFYSEGNAGDQLFFIDHNSTQTLEETMQLVTQYSDNIDLLQFATWNDFGEGTMLEPTTEFGFSFLTSIQSFLGVNYNVDELEQIFRLYNLRKEYSSNSNIQSSLDNAYWYFSQLDPEQAVAIMDQIEGINLSVPQNENPLVANYYPNPIKNNLQINVSNVINEPITIELFDTIGNSIMKFKKVNRNGKLELTSLEGLTNGVYYIKLSNKHTSQTIKIIKH